MYWDAQWNQFEKLIPKWTGMRYKQVPLEGLKFCLARRYSHLFTSDELVDILGKVQEEVTDDTKTFEVNVVDICV